MRELDIEAPDIDDTPRLAARIESICSSHGLTTHTKGTLRTYPGSIHWHFRRGSEPGTLEVTLWPAKRRLWFKVQAGRSAAWIDQLIPALKLSLEKG